MILSNRPSRFVYGGAQLVTSLPLIELPRQDTEFPATRLETIRLSSGLVDVDLAGQGPAMGSRSQIVSGLECLRVGSAILFRVSGVADFLIEQDGVSITVAPRATCSEPALNHWLLDQLLPRVLAHQGRTVLHAAAVRATPERAIAFLGDTGAGKSTLTASLHASGYPLLSDDALVLKPAQNGVTALPTYPSLRLWPDAIAELYEEAPPVVPMARDSTKQRVLIDAEGAATDKPVPLAALYLLERASDTVGNGISITRLSGRDACMAIISNAFQLDPSDTQRAARLMRAAADVARHVPAFSLSYPREFACLPDVCTAVIEHSRGLARVTHEAAESG